MNQASLLCDTVGLVITDSANVGIKNADGDSATAQPLQGRRKTSQPKRHYGTFGQHSYERGGALELANHAIRANLEVRPQHRRQLRNPSFSSSTRQGRLYAYDNHYIPRSGVLQKYMLKFCKRLTYRMCFGCEPRQVSLSVNMANSHAGSKCGRGACARVDHLDLTIFTFNCHPLLYISIPFSSFQSHFVIYTLDR